MEPGIEFFTATCLNWQPLLREDSRKTIVLDSLKFLVEDGRIWLYGFVIMPNHVHLLWCKRDKWVDKNIQQMFLKYTAQQIKFDMINNQKLDELEQYRSTQSDREFHFWERRPFKATMYNRKAADQKIDYIHYNPVKAKLCSDPEEYKYSSFAFYELNEDRWGFLTHYADHL